MARAKRAPEDATAASAQAQQDAVSDGIENYELPRALVTRIAKSALPENTKLQKETVLALVKGSTVFINYLAATAHDVAVSKQHKSVSASDVLKALETIEFGDMVDSLQGDLQAYRDGQKGKKSTPPTVGPIGASAAGKGKGKATVTIPARSVSASASVPPASASTSRPSSRMDVDAVADADADMEAEGAEVPEVEGEGEQSEIEADGPGADVDADEEVDEGDEDEDEGEGEGDEDKMAVEAEEVRRDHLGVVSREVDARRRREEEAARVLAKA